MVPTSTGDTPADAVDDRDRARAGVTARQEPDVDDLDDDLGDDDMDDLAVARPARRDLSPRTVGWVLVAFGLVGFAASLALAIEKVLKLADPNHVASCSINIFLDCADAMASWQGELLGFPNAFIGLGAFPVVVTTGVVVLAGVRLPRWYWRGLLAGTTAALGLVVFLVYTSVVEIGKLCPYCMVVWTAVIPLFWFTVTYAVQEGYLRVADGVRTVVLRNRYLLLAALYLAVVAWVLIGLAPAIADHVRMG